MSNVSHLRWQTDQLDSVGVLHQVVMLSPLRAIGMVIRTMTLPSGLQDLELMSVNEDPVTWVTCGT